MKPTTVNVKRLRKLADFLNKLPENQFDFSTIRRKGAECGTVGCAIGWCPNVFPNLVRTRLQSRLDDYNVYEVIMRKGGKRSDDYVDTAAKLFNMPQMHALEIFTPGCFSPANREYLGLTATTAQVAARIRLYADWAEREGIRGGHRIKTT